MLESIFHEGDEKHGRNHLVGDGFGNVDAYFHLVGVAQPHQCHVVLQELYFLVQHHVSFVAFIEHITHHFRKLHDAVLRLFLVDAYQRVNVVERVHEEVGVYLVLQVLKLMLQVFPFQFLHRLVVFPRLEE